jgi:error-prone DNA polymerase
VRERRSRAELLVAGVKVATQTPPIRTGRRVVFLTLDDSTGPVDATFFEDAQGSYASTVFHSWLLVVRGVLRKTGNRGISLRATGAWELPMLWDLWTEQGLTGVRALLAAEGDPSEPRRERPRVDGPASTFNGGIAPADAGGATPGRILGTSRDDGALPGRDVPDWEVATGLPRGDQLDPRGDQNPHGDRRSQGDRTGRWVLVHASGYRQSPYADVGTPGDDTRQTRRMLAAEEATAREKEAEREQSRRAGRAEPPRKLWHSSPGSSGQ